MVQSSSDPFETTLPRDSATFRQAFQKRQTYRLKLTPIEEKYGLRFSFDVTT